MANGIVRIEFKTDNAAFDEYRLLHITNILGEIAYLIESHWQTEGIILDVNGNRIVTWTTEGTNE